MGSPATLVIEILADTRKAQAGMKSAEGAASKASSGIKSHMKAIGGAIAGAFAADKIVDFAKESVGAASDLNETMSKTQQIFGKSGNAVVNWSKDSANAMGLSQQAALDAADNFATLGQAAGLTGPKLVTFSTHLTGLAGDMASFSNTTPAEAADALGAALRGETEPIRKYGVMIDDASVKAQALSMGLVHAKGDVLQIKRAQLSSQNAQAAYTKAIKEHGAKSKEAHAALEKLKIAQLTLGKAVKGNVPQLTRQQKVLATQSLIYKQTKNAQGDFKRTSGGLANQQRILAAKMENVKATLGKFLLPLVLKAVTGFQKFAHWAAQNKKTLVPLGIAIGSVAVAVKAINVATKAWTAISKAWTVMTKAMAAAQWLLNAAMEANPIVLIIAAIVALIAVLVLAYKKFKWFRDFVNGVWHAITGAVKWAVDFIKQHWQTILIILTGPIGLAVKLILKYRDKIVGFFKDLPGKIKGFLSGLWNIIKAPFVKAWNWIQQHVGKPLKNFFRLFPAVVKIALSNLWNTITKPFKKAWDWIQDHVGKPLKNFFRLFPQVVRMALSNLWNIIKSPFEKAWNWINNHFISPLRNFFQNAPGAVGRALSGLAGKITAPFKEAWDWIDKHVFKPIGNFFSDLPSKVTGAVADFSKSVVNAIVNTLNSVLNLPWVIELHIHGPGPLPDLNFGPYTVLPRIPTLASGGFFDRPTLAMVGEAGNEVVAPEPMLRRLIREELALGGIHITVNGALDPDRVARQIEDLLEQRRRRVGGIARRGTALTTGVAS